MKLHLWAFGKLKAPGLELAAEHYRAMLRTWMPLEVVELKPLPVPEKSPALREKIQIREGQMILERLAPLSQKGRSVLYLLDELGKVQTTQGWAQQVRDWESQSLTDVVLCVGSSLGFSQELRKHAKGMLSLGPQTLPHELARVVLIEQLFRAWSVVKGHPYHHEGS